jgi:outer membrane protein OmpA-like peptidoglycan-associated protein
MASPSDHSSEQTSAHSPTSHSSSDHSLEGLIELLLGGGEFASESSEQAFSSDPSPPQPSSTASPPPGQKLPKNSVGSDLKFHQSQTAPAQSPQRRGSSSESSASSRRSAEGSSAHFQALIDQLESKVTRLERQVYEPTDLINPLLPLIRELLSLKSADSSEAILQKLVPFIDEAIRLRSEQANDKMGAAIASVLPTAIAHEIKQSPASIAKAIAPELALSIREQVKLDSTALSGALGPQMGEAIKQQIVLERDAMVDALYPVIGNTISKYMLEVVKSINAQVESSLSPAGIWRRIRARFQGVSEAELILRESLGFKIRAILLIHKSSGLVIREILPSSEFQVETSMLAGMLTAIRNFVNDCIGQPSEDSELHQIEYDASQIILEVAGYCYLAVVVKGAPSKLFLEKIRETLSQIVLKAGNPIAQFDGEPTTVPNTVDVVLDELLQAEPKPKQSKSPKGLLILLGLILIPCLFLLYRSYLAHRVIAHTTEALDASPELSIYRVTPQVNWGTLTLNGRLPNERLRTKAEQITHQVAPQWPLKNKVIAVEVAPEPIATAGEIDRITWIYNQKPGTSIKTQHEFNTNRVLVTGVATDPKEVEQLAQALNQVPGISTVTSTVQIRPVLETRLYFAANSAQMQSAENLAKLKFIRQFLDENPGVHLKIIGHSDQTGTEPRNQALSLNRAKAVQEALIAEGVNPARLVLEASRHSPPDITPDRPLWLSRSVRFEVVIPSMKQP